MGFPELGMQSEDQGKGCHVESGRKVCSWSGHSTSQGPEVERRPRVQRAREAWRRSGRKGVQTHRAQWAAGRVLTKSGASGSHGGL